MKRKFLQFFNAVKTADIFSERVFSVLFSGIGVCTAIIVTAQFGLRNTATRRFFTKIDSYEGAYFEAAAIAENDEPERILLYAEGDGFPEAQILVNGEEYSELKNGENEIVISGWSVVEIYSPKGKNHAVLKSISDGVSAFTAEKDITADGEIKLFGRFALQKRK